MKRGNIFFDGFVKSPDAVLGCRPQHDPDDEGGDGEFPFPQGISDSDLPTPKGWPAAMDERSREHGARRLSTLGLARDDGGEREKLRLMNFKFYGAPCAVFLFMDRSLGEWSIFDMGLFSQNLILAAHSLGVGSCLQASVINYAQEIKKFLGVEASKKLVICIALGYPNEKAVLNTYRSIKQKPDEFTRWHE